MGGGKPAVIWSNGSSFSVKVGGASGGIVMSWLSGAKPSISIRIVHAPSARLASRYTPC